MTFARASYFFLQKTENRIIGRDRARQTAAWAPSIKFFQGTAWAKLLHEMLTGTHVFFGNEGLRPLSHEPDFLMPDMAP